jgi:hypothetical protein
MICNDNTTLKRSGKSGDEIGEMMGHSASQVTEHYLASLDMDQTIEINEGSCHVFGSLSIFCLNLNKGWW